MGDETPRDMLRWCWCSIPIALLVAVPAAGRDVSVGGGISSSYEYYSREYDTEKGLAQADEVESQSDQKLQNRDDKSNRFRLSPLVTLKSVSARDQFNLRYNPSVSYDEETADHDIDQNLSANYAYSLTQQWRLNLDESFVLADQSLQDTATTASRQDKSASFELSDNEGRRRHWKNDLTLSSDYRYWEDSTVSLGYSLGRLKHIDASADSGYQDYFRHTGTLSVSHRFDSVWRLSGNGSYSRGLFDNADETDLGDETAQTTQNDDLHEYRASTGLEFRSAEHHLLSLKYGFTGVDYDDVNQGTTALHDATAGWLWELAKDTSFFLGAGPSYNKTEGQEGEWGYNAGMKLRYGLERGAFELSLDRGYDIQNFTGTDERGLSEYWQTRLDFSHQLLEDLSLRLFVNYRYEDQEEVIDQRLLDTTGTAAGDAVEQELAIDTDTFNRKRIGAGTSLSYKLARWYAISLSYNYTTQDSEQIDDSYDEHRLVLSLSMERELFQW